jgi:hypothetical protein
LIENIARGEEEQGETPILEYIGKAIHCHERKTDGKNSCRRRTVSPNKSFLYRLEDPRVVKKRVFRCYKRTMAGDGRVKHL